MLISVTQTHIDKGMRQVKCECPIALALHDKGFGNAVVGSWRVSLVGVRTSVVLPVEAQSFIKAFDTHCPVAPFEFNLDLPEGIAEPI